MFSSSELIYEDWSDEIGYFTSCFNVHPRVGYSCRYFSCVNEDLNVGFLGIAFGIIVGGVFGGTPATKIMNAFPLSLFMILVGVTFLFGMAQTNGTMEKLTAYSIRVCKGNTALIPIIIFLLSDFS